MIETIEDIEQFERLAPEWNALLGSSDSDSVFLTWEWLHTWWRHLAGDRQLRVLAVRAGHRLLALLPLDLRPGRPSRLMPFPVLEFMGTGPVGSDYLDVIVRRGAEEAALTALADHLARGRKMLELAQVSQIGALARDLAERVRAKDWGLVEVSTSVCPYIPLAGKTWESYQASLGPSHRVNLRRRMRDLGRKFDVRFEEARTHAERREALRVLIDLHNRRRAPLGGSDAFYLPALTGFHEAFTALALERGWLRLYLLRVDGRPVAALYGLLYGGRFSFYQSGFDPEWSRHSVGLVALGLAIQRAIEAGAEEFDLLHGDEPYKFLWTRSTRALCRLEIFPPTARGLLHRGVIGVTRKARRVARRILSLALATRIVRGRSVSPSWSPDAPRAA